MKIACMSDVHGNLYALEKALRLIEQTGAEEIIFLGDSVGYIPGVRALRRIKELDIPCIMGNHDYMLLRKDVPPQKDVVYGLGLTLQQATQEDISFVRQWPDKLHKHGGSFFHASPENVLNGYVYPDTDLKQFQNMLPDNTRFCVMGHTHRPFIRIENRVTYINVSSVGLPRDDGRYGAFALIDTRDVVAKILRFDITDEMARSISEFGPVHESVAKLQDRRAVSSIEGEILDD